MNKWLKTVYSDLLALFAGMILTLAFAPYEIFPFAIISPAILLAIWLKASPVRAFWLGFVFGLGLFGTGVHWVFISIHAFGGVPDLPAAIITAGFIAILALFPATVGYLTNRYFPATTTAKMLCAFPAIWVFSEWIRSWIFTGFPWLFLGYSQTNAPLKGYAPLLSVYGVSLAVLISSSLVVNAVSQIKQQAYQAAYFSLFAFITIWVAGELLSFIPWTQPNGKSIPVSLVQGNIPQEIKWSPEHVNLSLERYEKLTEPLWKNNELIIWPEAAIPLPLQQASSFIEAMDEKAKASHSHLILGIPIQAINQDGYYNAVVSLGKNQDIYLKHRLVPFGEYMPLPQLFSRIMGLLDIPMSNMIPGMGAPHLLTIDGIKILTSICYEIAFPELAAFRDQSIGLLLTVTNDAWFGRSNAQAQHLQMAQMRAIELGRPVLFVSNDGITAMIAPDGKVLSAAPPYQPYVLSSSVQPTSGRTPWQRFSMDPLLIILFGLLGIAIRARMRTINS